MLIKNNFKIFFVEIEIRNFKLDIIFSIEINKSNNKIGAEGCKHLS
jgi:hypothetical protein